ncbi:MAG: hypothetical protein COA42_10430 [Alteromonadaceae bacterium]|nr:MAG: hypothetical protein COA42_10430 [Alteromonadaceae bacterium]
MNTSTNKPMNKSLKAVLLSALVYPGVGHYFLKKYIACAIFASIFTIPLFLIVKGIMIRANHVAEQIRNGAIPLDLGKISTLISDISSGPDTQALNIQTYALMIIWFASILDSYRVSIQKNQAS